MHDYHIDPYHHAPTAVPHHEMVPTHATHHAPLAHHQMPMHHEPMLHHPLPPQPEKPEQSQSPQQQKSKDTKSKKRPTVKSTRRHRFEPHVSSTPAYYDEMFGVHPHVNEMDFNAEAEAEAAALEEFAHHHERHARHPGMMAEPPFFTDDAPEEVVTHHQRPGMMAEPPYV